MSINFSNIKAIEAGKSVVVYSPIEGEDTIVRTGTIGDGSCLFHAIFQACLKEYPSLSQKEKIKLVENVRKKIANTFTIEQWKNLNDGMIYKVSIQENIYKYIEEFYNTIINNKKSIFSEIVNSKPTLYSIISEILPQKILEQQILPKSYQKENANIKTNIIKEIITYLDNLEVIQNLVKSKADIIIKTIVNVISQIIDQAEKISYENYIRELENSTEFIDSQNISMISDYFDRDIYFIDAKNRMPYNNTDNFKHRKSIIILWVDNIHYEIIGRLLPNNKIQREFDCDDILIQRINTFLCYPEKIKERYPDLISYLPLSYRSNLETSESETNSDTENESTSESDSDNEYVYKRK
jgi:hypothetical protein